MLLTMILRPKPLRGITPSLSAGTIAPAATAVPGWLRTAAAQPGTLEDVGFAAGAAVALLDAVVRRQEQSAGVWRQRLALTAAAAAAKASGRAEDEAALRDAVTLTTAHQAKGLEWQVVFAVWLADGMFPHKRAIEGDDEESIEEERRLFYVTVTRAKDELYLTYPVIHHQARDGDVIQRPSRFIKDVPPELMEAWNVKSGF